MKMKKVFLGVLMVVMLACGVGCVAGLPVMADEKNVCEDPSISDELKEVAGCKLDDDKTVMPVVVGLIQTALALIGLVAVIVLVYGGIMFIVSTGDANKVKTARNTIIYSIVGVVVATLAYAIVHFVSQGLWG